MEANSRINSVAKTANQNNLFQADKDRIFQSLKINIDDENVEISVRINQLYRNHFKVEYSDGMVTVFAMVDHEKLRMVSRTVLLPCPVDQDSQTTALNGNELSIRYERKMHETYMFDWQAMKELKTMSS